MPISSEEPRELLKTVVKWDQSNRYGPHNQYFPKGRIIMVNEDGSETQVTPVPGYAHITDLLDVHFSGQTDGDLIQYYTASSGWVNQPYLDMRAISAPANPSATFGRFYVKTIDSNNEGIFCKIKRNGSFVEVRLL